MAYRLVHTERAESLSHHPTSCCMLHLALLRAALPAACGLQAVVITQLMTQQVVSLMYYTCSRRIVPFPTGVFNAR